MVGDMSISCLFSSALLPFSLSAVPPLISSVHLPPLTTILCSISVACPFPISVNSRSLSWTNFSHCMRSFWSNISSFSWSSSYAYKSSFCSSSYCSSSCSALPKFWVTVIAIFFLHVMNLRSFHFLHFKEFVFPEQRLPMVDRLPIVVSVWLYIHILNCTESKHSQFKPQWSIT